MKTKQDIISEVNNIKTIDNEFKVYNFIVKNFLPQQKSFDSLEEYRLIKEKGELPKVLSSKYDFYSYNLTKNKLESVLYTARNGYEVVEVADNKIVNYSRVSIFYSGKGCCGGGTSTISDSDSFQNQIRAVDYDPYTLEKKSINHRLLEGKWIKTDLKTNEILQITTETKSCSLPENFKELLPDAFHCGCSSKIEPPLLYIADFTTKGNDKIIRFLIVESP